MKYKWNWYVDEIGTLKIFNGNDLYWEIDGCHKIEPKHIDKYAKKAIKELSFMLEDI